MNFNETIKDLMTENVITIHTDTPFTQACRIFKQFNIHHLPVTDNEGNIIGMFSANDALQAYNDKIYNRIITKEKTVNEVINIGDIMNDYKIYTVNINDTISKVLSIFDQAKVHALPVLENGKLFGIITSNDILNELATEIV